MMTEKEIVSKVQQDRKDATPYKDELDDQRADWIDIYNAVTLGNESKDKGKSAYISRDVKTSSEWQRSSLVDPFVSSPRPIKCYPIGPEDKPIADQNQSLLNYEFTRGFDRYTFVSDSIKVLQREGTVVSRVSWKFEEDEVEFDEPVMAMLPNGQQMQVGVNKVMKTVTTVNRAWVEPLDGKDVYVDPTAKTNVANAKFIIHKYKKNLSELKSEDRYEHLDLVESREARIAGQPNSADDFTYKEDSQKRSFVFSDLERRELDVYEYWGFLDLNQDGITEPVVIITIGDILIYQDDNPFPGGFLPFVSCAFNAEPFEINGEANAEVLKDGQILKSGAVRGMIDNMVNSTNGQVGFKKGSLDPINKRKFERGENFMFNTTAADIYQGGYNQLPGSVFDFVGMVSSEMEAYTGIKSFGSGSMGNSATATRGIMSATDNRELDIVRNIRENYIKPIMRMWSAMNAQWLEPEEVERITGKPYVPSDPVDVKGSMDIDMEISTASMDQQKAERIAFLLQTTAQFLPEDVVREMTAKMYDLDRMPELAQFIREYQPQPDPYAEQMKQLEMQKLQSEIAERTSRATENQSDIRLKESKANMEDAKLRNLDSDTDMKDQQFLDNESGFTRQKELDDKDIAHQQALEMQNKKSRNDMIAERGKQKQTAK